MERVPGASALRFPGEEALRLAIRSGLLPEAVLRAPARRWREAGGAIRVAPSVAIEGPVLAALAAAGVPWEDSEESAHSKRSEHAEQPQQSEHSALSVIARDRSGDEVGCWAELIAPRRAPEPGAEAGAVLFTVPARSSLLAFAGELLRLGCDRQELRAAKEEWLLRVEDPPWYALARALDHEGGLRAYTPARPGQERVWIEVGHGHPLAAALRGDGEGLLLIPGEGRWRALPDGEWTPIEKVVELAVPAASAPLLIAPPVGKLIVPPRLVRAAQREAPSLWVLRHDAEGEVERLVQSLPDEVVARLLYASATQAGERVVVLKARPGAKGPPALSVHGEAFAPLMQLTNLYLPVGAAVEPPLRREWWRERLAGDGRLTWLAAAGEGAFRVESIELCALLPLAEWVDYVVHANAEALEPWVRAATFAFEPFESTFAEWSDPPPAPALAATRAPIRPRRKGRREEAAPPVEESAPAAPVVTATASAELAPAALPEAPEPALAAELATLESSYLALREPAEAPARRALWVRMGELHVALRRDHDASLCFGQAMWELDAKEAAAVAARWRAAAPSAPGEWERILAHASPAREEIRAAARLLIAAERPPNDPSRVARFFDRHGDGLDPRSTWLVRLALARLAGGDRLALARARDALLGKLHRGLSAERDLPTFLRFVGGRDARATERLAAGLEELLERYRRCEHTGRARSTVEAPPALTRAYVWFVAAAGLARLGRGDRARALGAAAALALDTTDPIHGFLSRAYLARIEQAIEGRPGATPLPPKVEGELNGLDTFHRYKVDRLRQASLVLEPQERLDPVRGFQRGERDPRGDELASLRGATDAAEVGREVERIVERALGGSPPLDPDARARLLDGAMDFFPQLPSSRAAPLLERIAEVEAALDGIAPLRRAQLLEETLSLAGHFGRADLAARLLGTLKALLSGLRGSEAAEAGALLGGCLRALRRVGLGEEAAGLLEAMAGSATGRGAAQLVARLHLAAGLVSLGHFDRARPILDEVEGALDDPALLIPERLAITRALARAVAGGPAEHAAEVLERLADQLPAISDSYATNSHFCLSVVSFMESLVLGWAGDELAPGELGQRRLDEDEHRIRRRVHRDLSRESP